MLLLCYLSLPESVRFEYYMRQHEYICNENRFEFWQPSSMQITTENRRFTENNDKLMNKLK